MLLSAGLVSLKRLQLAQLNVECRNETQTTQDSIEAVFRRALRC